MSTGFLVTTVLVAPLLVAATYPLLGWRRSTSWLGATSAIVLLTSSVLVAVSVTDSAPRTFVAGLFYVDALTAFMLIVIAAVSLLATVAAPSHLRTEIEAGRLTTRGAAIYGILVQLFIATMVVAVLAADLGVLWVAIEATTIVTAFLVGQRRTRAAVEAAWKYVIICSAGIALALLGIIVLNFAGSNAAGGQAGLDIATLTSAAGGMDADTTRIAIVLMMIGFGTKAGLAPLHGWLPDAHSQAPGPVSALMSGVLLSVAMYAILRVKVISDAALGEDFARSLLAVMALASLVVATALLLDQRDYKRMLTYSSIEHMGLVAFGAAIGGPLAIAAMLLHILGHGLAKGVLFIGAGRLLQVTGTSRIASLRGLLAEYPLLAGCFGVGVLAVIGLPPFSVFASELGIVRAGLDSDLAWVTALILVLVLVIAASLVRHTAGMVIGSPSRAAGQIGTTAPPTAAVLIGGLVVCAVLGIAAEPLAHLLDAAAHILTGEP